MAVANLLDTERWLDWFNKMNEMIDELNSGSLIAIQAQLDAYEANQIPVNFDYDETLTSTTFSTFAGTYIKGSSSYDVLANSFVIANDDITTIYVDLSDDTIKGVLTSGVATSGIIPLYEVTVAANVQTLVKDLRTAAHHTLYETAAELLAAIKTVDGPASGLNADLLDGIEGAGYLQVGAFGVGGTSINTADFNALIPTDNGFYHNAAVSATGAPDASAWWSVISNMISSSGGVQYAQNATTGTGFFMRRKLSNVWQAWVKLHDAGDIGSVVQAYSAALDSVSGTNTGDEDKASIDALGVDATTLDSISSEGFVLSTSVATSTDLDTVIVSGAYRLLGAMVNAPFGATDGNLLVLHGAADTITQIIASYVSGDIWTRSGNPSDVGGAGAWTAWFKLATPDKQQNWIAQQVTPPVVLSPTATIAWNLDTAPNATIALDGTTTAMGTPTNIRAGNVVNISMEQDVTGSRVVTWPAAFEFGDGDATLTTTASKFDVLSFLTVSTTKLRFLGIVKGFAN